MTNCKRPFYGRLLLFLQGISYGRNLGNKILPIFKALRPSYMQNSKHKQTLIKYKKARFVLCMYLWSGQFRQSRHGMGTKQIQ